MSFNTIICCYSIRHWQKIYVFWKTVCLCKTINLVTITHLLYIYWVTEALLFLATLLGDDKLINIEVCRVNEAFADCILSKTICLVH